MDALTSVILIKGSNSGIFDDFLRKRKEKLSFHLKKHDKSAKNHINLALSSIANVLVIVNQIFLKEKLKQEIENIAQEKTVQLLNVNVESPVMEFLPSIVRDFKLMGETLNEPLEVNFQTFWECNFMTFLQILTNFV